MRISKITALIVIGLLIRSTGIYAQILPASYQPMLNEIVENFKTIVGSNSITQGKTTLSVLDANKIALRTIHKKKDKNFTFVTELDEENKLRWVAATPLTIDMVNKYEDDLTKTLKTMHKLSVKKSKE